MSKIRTGLRAINPFGPIIHAYRAVRRSGHNVEDMVRGVRATAADMRKPVELDSVQQQGAQIEDGKERFLFYYRARNFTKNELAQRVRQAKNGQAAYLAYTAGMLVLAGYTAYQSGGTVSGAVVVLLALFGAAVFGGLAVKMAWHKAQLQERNLMTLHSFLSRRDAIPKCLVPWL